MNATFDESGDHTGRNAAAGSLRRCRILRHADRDEQPRRCRPRPSTARRRDHLALEADEREVLAVGRGCGLVVERAVGQLLGPSPGTTTRTVALRLRNRGPPRARARVVVVVSGTAVVAGLRRGRRGGRCGRIRVVAARRQQRWPEATARSPSVACGEGTAGGLVNQCSERRNARPLRDDACGASEAASARGPIGSRRWRGGVEHRDHAAVGGGADEASGALREQHGGPGDVDLGGRRTDRRAPGGPAATGRRAEGTAGGRSSRATGSGRARRGPARSPWWRRGTTTPPRRRRRAGAAWAPRPGRRMGGTSRLASGGAASHRPPRREQRERSTARGIDERLELVVQRGLHPAWRGRARVPRSRGAPAQRTRTGCRRRSE